MNDWKWTGETAPMYRGEGPTFTVASFPTAAGYFTLWDGFKVAALTKPDAKHVAAMEDAFGWKWEDA